MSRGRPSKYTRKAIQIAEDYLAQCKNQRKVPWIEELAALCGVSENTIDNWSEAHKEFLSAVEQIKDHQRMTLKTLGLKSPAVIIFLLEANHGMMRTEKIQHEGKGGEPLSIIFTDVATWKRAKENEKQNA